MKIGIFDSGLGGLVITKAIIRKLPKYDFIYLGDTKRVPYGNRSQETIYEFTKQAVEYLFKQNCLLVILACNSASAMALRRLQREFLPKKYPKRRILGVIVPTVEIASQGKRAKKIAVIATAGTINSHIYRKELSKINKNIQVSEKAAPLLVPLVENGGVKFAKPVLEDYLKEFKGKIDGLVLGCTHYPILKNLIKNIIGKKVKIISQDEIIPAKLIDYLKRHPEINKKLSRTGKRKFLVTDIAANFQETANRMFGKNISFNKIKL